MNTQQKIIQAKLWDHGAQELEDDLKPLAAHGWRVQLASPLVVLTNSEYVGKTGYLVMEKTTSLYTYRCRFQTRNVKSSDDMTELNELVNQQSCDGWSVPRIVES